MPEQYGSEDYARQAELQSSSTGGIDYSLMVKSLAKPGSAIAQEITADQAHLMHMAIGIAGEAGELLDAIKKHVIYRAPLDRTNVIEELGDLEFYLEGLRQGIETSRAAVLSANQKKLGKRYGQVYSDASATTRKDKA